MPSPQTVESRSAARSGRRRTWADIRLDDEHSIEVMGLLLPVLYFFWVWYKGNWTFSGASPTKVSIATYYRNASGSWVYWQSSPLLAPTGSWSLANFASAPLPAGASAISFGLAISGPGTVTTDDYALAIN